MNEIWLPIKNFDGYEISNLGNIKSTRKSKIAKPIIPYIGYKYLAIKLRSPDKKTNKTFFVHKLVVLTFLENPYSKKQVNHIDGNKLNNKISNLEWVTESENALHARRVLKVCGRRPVICYDKNNNIIGYYDSLTQAAEKHGTTKHSIFDYVNNRRVSKTHKGLFWKYV